MAVDGMSSINQLGIACEIVNVKVQRKNINNFVLDTAIGKVDRTPRQIWITQKVIKDERRKQKNVNNVEGRKEELQKTEDLIDREHREGQQKYLNNI